MNTCCSPHGNKQFSKMAGINCENEAINNHGVQLSVNVQLNSSFIGQTPVQLLLSLTEAAKRGKTRSKT